MSHRRLVLMLVLAAGAGMIRPASGHAQSLADQIPDTTWVYVAWRGGPAVQPAYLQSTLRQVVDLIDSPQLRAAWTGLSRAITQGMSDTEGAALLVDARQLGRISLRSPMALAVLAPADPPDATDTPDAPDNPGTPEAPNAGNLQAVVGEPGEPGGRADKPGVLLMWQPSEADRPALIRLLRRMLDELDMPEANRPRLVTHESRVSLRFNAAPPAAPSDVPPDAPPAERDADGGRTALADSPAFSRAMQRVGGPKLLSGFVNLPAMIGWLEQGLTDEGEADTLAVLEALNLDGLGHLALTAGFHEEDWQTSIFLGAPAPREGLASLLDAPPLKDDALRVVPRDAPWLWATTFDLGRLLEVVREAVAASGPDAADQFEQALAQASAMTGVDIETQLINGLGPAWIAYLDPEAMGMSINGLTLVNELEDPTGVEQALRSLEAVANRMMAGRGGDAPGRVQFHTIARGEVVLHKLGVPLYAPTWAVHGGRLYVGLYPQAVLTAAGRGDVATSIVDNEAFIAARDRAGAGRLTGMSFIDLPRTAAISFAGLVSLETLATGAASMFTGQAVPSLLPPLAALRPHLRPASSVSWVDDAGYHARYISPFPGATLLGPYNGGSATTVAPLLMGAMLPAVGAARSTARQLQDATRARTIHQAMVVYANEHDQRKPTDIGLLVAGGQITGEMLVATSGEQRLAPGFNQWEPLRQADWARQHSDYIIMPDLGDDPQPDVIAIVSRPGVVEDGIIVTYNDNYTSFEQDVDAIEQQLIEQTGMSLDQLIARQEALVGQPITPAP